jgi:DNA-binding NarL/FixJ family response regulator
VRTVVIVDDHETFRATARQLLNAEGFVVVGEAIDASSAVETVSRLRPDVLLLDVVLPGADGFAVIDMLVAAGHLPQTVLISSRQASTFRRRMATTPARGFISKDDLSGSALEALLIQ